MGVITFTSPVVPLLTVAVMEVSDNTVNVLAGVPPNKTETAPVKFFPFIEIVCPLLPRKGVKLVIEGAPLKINPPKTPVPRGLVTSTRP